MSFFVQAVDAFPVWAVIFFPHVLGNSRFLSVPVTHITSMFYYSLA